MFIAALFTIAKIWKQPKWPSTDKWIKKMWYRNRHTRTDMQRNTSIPHFIALYFTVFQKCCISHKLKARPSSSKKDNGSLYWNAGCIMVVWSLTSVSRSYSCMIQLWNKKEILLFVTTWMNLEGNMLSEISHTKKTNIIQFHLDEKSETFKLIKTKSRMLVTRGRECSK